MTETTNNKPKVILLNGSAHAEGTTYRALKEVADTLEKEGVEAEIIHVGHLAVRGCSECYACGKLKKCVHDDIVNEIAEKFKDADGMIIGLDKRYALELVRAGDVLVEYDKLIDRQLERAAITSISGFGKICDGAMAVLNV